VGGMPALRHRAPNTIASAEGELAERSFASAKPGSVANFVRPIGGSGTGPDRAVRRPEGLAAAPRAGDCVAPSKEPKVESARSPDRGPTDPAAPGGSRPAGSGRTPS